jgi:hypothetical protein
VDIGAIAWLEAGETQTPTYKAKIYCSSFVITLVSNEAGCRWVGTKDGEEFVTVDILSKSDCENPSLGGDTISCSRGPEEPPCTGSVEITKYHLINLSPYIDPYGCGKPFCGDCNCTCETLCVTLADYNGYKKVDWNWNGSGWSGEGGEAQLSRDPYTGVCLLTVNDHDPIEIVDCLEGIEFMIIEGDWGYIRGKCKECSCKDSGCCPERPYPDPTLCHYIEYPPYYMPCWLDVELTISGPTDAYTCPCSVRGVLVYTSGSTYTGGTDPWCNNSEAGLGLILDCNDTGPMGIWKLYVSYPNGGGWYTILLPVDVQCTPFRLLYLSASDTTCDEPYGGNFTQHNPEFQQPNPGIWFCDCEQSCYPTLVKICDVVIEVTISERRTPP